MTLNFDSSLKNQDASMQYYHYDGIFNPATPNTSIIDPLPTQLQYSNRADESVPTSDNNQNFADTGFHSSHINVIPETVVAYRPQLQTDESNFVNPALEQIDRKIMPNKQPARRSTPIILAHQIRDMILTNRAKSGDFKVHDANVMAGVGKLRSFDAGITPNSENADGPYCNLSEERLEKLSFKAVVLSFHELTYVIPARRKHFWTKKLAPKVVLDKVSGIFTPGVNAIMGPSGGGKTSLLTVLGGRRDIDVDGEILLDGRPISKNFRNESGFVTQEDVLMGTLTVRENMMFSASLRLPAKISVQKKARIVTKLIQELHLEKCADTKVGTELIRGISGGEKKRCNIGVELVILPSLLFLDEPTSGLDAATAVTVIQLLKKLSDKGCNIIMSIHQPRFEIFKMFHTLILLSSGHVVFHGLSDKALDYFAALGFECEIHNNPADFFLDVIEKNAPARIRENGEIDDTTTTGYHDMPKVNLPEMFVKSSTYSSIMGALDVIIENKAVHKKRNFFRRHIMCQGVREIYPTNFCQQFKIVGKRTFMNLYRNPQPFLVQSFTMIIYSLIVGFIYFRIGNSAEFGLQNRIGALFFILMNQVFGNLSAIELFMKERPLYVHEATNGFYRVSVYFLSKLFCDLIPMRFIPVLLVSIIAYWLIGLRPYAANYFIFILSLLCLTTSASSIALLASVSYDSIGVATNYCALYFVFMMVFGGLFVNLKSISYKIRWLQYISIFRYSYNALLVNELKDSEFCGPSPSSRNFTEDPECVYGNHYLEKQGIPYKTAWNLFSNHVALICIIFIFWMAAYYQLRRLKIKAK